MQMSIILVRFLFAVTATVSTEGLTAEEKQQILKYHNDVRSNVQPTASNMLKLKWSDELATTAQGYAGKCIWSPNSERSSNSSFSRVGENRYLTIYSYSGKTAVEGWANGAKFYNFMDSSCSISQCGHYTQVVWAETEYLGCGVKKCSSVQGYNRKNVVIVVCNYGKGGNNDGQRPYKSGLKCSDCPSETKCVEGLCADASVTAAVSTQGLTAEGKQQILDYHNEVRANVQPPASNMLKLKWSDELATTAQGYADKCIWGHNSERSSNSPFSRVGENIYFTTGYYYNGQEVVDAWANEASGFNFFDSSCSIFECGHYTQIVWAEMEYVGCGFKRCSHLQRGSSNAAYIVCNYSKQAYRRAQPYKSGATCSQCPSGLNKCVNRLCTDA